MYPKTAIDAKVVAADSIIFKIVDLKLGSWSLLAWLFPPPWSSWSAWSVGSGAPGREF